MKKKEGLSLGNRFLKRGFDLILSMIGLLLIWWVIFLAFIIATVDTKKSGFFLQERIGLNGKGFRTIKLRTMREIEGISTSITQAGDRRITPVGAFFRKTKLDELPQLINVFLGHMSFVGPRPDVPGYADRLTDRDRAILAVRPGITGPATLKYRYEEEILAKVENPDKYNDEVIYPDKVRINREYVSNYSFTGDVYYIIRTIRTIANWR
jgi:lipopolysaccharide/colanic/teichoic acid biosynthesis glycosyltransferase